jgi:outer membrane protein insertion porin family
MYVRSKESMAIQHKLMPQTGTASLYVLGTSIMTCLWAAPTWSQSSPSKVNNAVPQSEFARVVLDSMEVDSSFQFSPSDFSKLADSTSNTTHNKSAPSTQAQDLFPSSTIPLSSDATQNLFPTQLKNSKLAQNENPNNPSMAKEDKPFSFYFGSKLPDPTALSGPTRSPIVPASEKSRSGVAVSAGFKINVNQSLKLFTEVAGGESMLGGDLSLFSGSDDLRNGVAFNFFGQQSFSPSFSGGELKVKLPNGKTPWLERIGGGVEIRRGLTKNLQSTVGITYQSVSVQDGLFGSNRQRVDQFGNPLTVSSGGRDDLLTLNLGLEYDTRDNPKNPLKGTHFRFGLDQSIPTGQGNIGMTRLSASASQFFKLPFFSGKNSTFVVSIQGGHILGDVPPYEAFSLGGDDTVRGYGDGDVGTGSSFVQASAEYRFPLFNAKVFKRPIDVGGVLFADYGSLLGTQDEVIGQPGAVRNKPGDGFGYGLGIRLGTGFGIIRLEVGFNQDGEIEPHITLGQRF